MDDWCLWIYYHYYVKLLTEADPNPDFLAFVREAGKVTKTVSYAEFEDYYEGLSLEIPDDEEYINNLRATWSIWGHSAFFIEGQFLNMSEILKLLCLSLYIILHIHIILFMVCSVVYCIAQCRVQFKNSGSVRLILLFSKDALNWSKVTKTFDTH